MNQQIAQSQPKVEIKRTNEKESIAAIIDILKSKYYLWLSCRDIEEKKIHGFDLVHLSSRFLTMKKIMLTDSFYMKLNMLKQKNSRVDRKHLFYSVVIEEILIDLAELISVLTMELYKLDYIIDTFTPHEIISYDEDGVIEAVAPSPKSISFNEAIKKGMINIVENSDKNI